MRKLLLVLMSIVLFSFLLVACGKEESTEPDTTRSSEEDGAVTGECEHDWELLSFVTEETDIPFAAHFSCKKCNESKTDSFDYKDIEIPLISVAGDLSSVYDNEKGLSKDVKVEATLSYKSADLCFDTPASFAYQGKSSNDDPKQNYSVNILDATGKKKKMTFRETWGAGSKYVLKANYSEPSGVRNIALSSLYGQVAHSRDLEDSYSDLVNGGAVDGYPVLFYINGQYQGLYNWVIRKDKWLYGMGEADAGEAVLVGSDMGALESEEGVVILPEGMASAKSWKEEYVNEDYGEEGWAEVSFNEMLFAVRNAAPDSIREVIAEYTELDRVLDVVLFNCVFGTADNVTGNQVWCTYDGKRWAPVPYDFDRTLGRSGNCLEPPTDSIPESVAQNMLYDKIVNAYFEEIAARYAALRKDIFTTENVMSVLREKLGGMDDKYFLAELEKWPDALWRECEGSEEIKSFEDELHLIEEYLTARFEYCDGLYGVESK